MRLLFALLLMFSPSLLRAEESIRFSVAESILPETKAIVLVESGKPGPGQAKHRPLYSLDKLPGSVTVATSGSFDIYWVGKEGLPVRIVQRLAVKESEKKEVKLHDYLGVVRVRGEGLPRPDNIVVTAQDDPGPDEKGHQPIQSAPDFKTDLVLPEGFYALWVVPANGSRAKKVNDRFRVLPGKVVTLD
jgi:hypothetical protein